MGAKKKDPHAIARTALRAAALGYPETTEEFPWGDRVVKVRGKVFVFLGADEGGFGMSVKLPVSHDAALTLGFATPTAYGLGRHGWITARFALDEDVPVPLLLEWLDESYRAVAPKRREKAAAKKNAATRKPAAKKPAVTKKPAAKR